MPEVLIECLCSPLAYSQAQLKHALVLARFLELERLIICEPPAGPLLPPRDDS